LKYRIQSRVIASQSINIRLINQKKHKHKSRLGIGTVTMTAPYKVNKKALEILAET